MDTDGGVEGEAEILRSDPWCRPSHRFGVAQNDRWRERQGTVIPRSASDEESGEGIILTTVGLLPPPRRPPAGWRNRLPTDEGVEGEAEILRSGSWYRPSHWFGVAQNDRWRKASVTLSEAKGL